MKGNVYMPSANAKINFKAGLQSSFDKLTKDLNTVYFITDTQRFFVGETEYSRPVSYGSSLPTGYLPPNSLFVHVKLMNSLFCFFLELFFGWCEIRVFVSKNLI